jgi:hypothetical protein
MKILGIEFAPLRVPLRRRLQTYALFYSWTELISGSFGLLILALLILFTQYYLLPSLYLAWLIYDKDTPEQGGRLMPWSRRLPIWKWFAEYFPLKLIKTAELDTSKNYIIGYHPHGVIATGAFGCFATEGTGFSEIFPGINPRLVTLPINFWFPYHRDCILARGLISSSRKSINWVLQKCGTGNAVVIVVGGAQESLDAIPSTMRLTLKSRKGFVKIALMNGASLVPCIGFGENDLYSQKPRDEKSFVYKFQSKVKQILKFTVPIINGRGVFQYSIGILPHRKPNFTVVGKPVELPKIDDPSQEEIDKYHLMYMQSLSELFEENKEKYAAKPSELQLEFQ